MRWLIYSDVHGNWEALQAVWAAAEGQFDLSICLGDIVGYGASPNETAEWVQRHSNIVIRGNHDRVCGCGDGLEEFNAVARSAALWTHQQLRPEMLNWVLQLPAGPVKYDGMLLAHGSPHNEDEYILAGYQAARVLAEAGPQVSLIGHTHIQGGWERGPTGDVQPLLLPHRPEVWLATSAAQATGFRQTIPLRQGCRYLINPGSVGQPRDRDWRAAFVMIQDDPPKLTFGRVPYDLARARDRIFQAGLPAALGFRLERGQ